MARQAYDIVTRYDGKPLRIMEVCGTHTHEIFRLGIRQLLPPALELISGPGCPVCVTPVSFIDEAIWLALERGVTICTFGDLIRVPGTQLNLAAARSCGARIEPVYAPQDAVMYAAAHGEEEVVFLAVGFETTAPAACLAVQQAEAAGLTNFSLLTANKTMPNAYRAMAGSCDAFIYPGHVHAVIGTAICEELATQGISGVIAGFTAKELLTALAYIVVKSGAGEPFFQNCYPRVVRREGSPKGQAIIDGVMELCDTEWRGLGVIPSSGLQLRAAYAAYDSRLKFAVPKQAGKANPACRCGDVLQGKCRPVDCPVFGKACTPDHAVGACMVSHEGTCAAFYQYGGI
ncbi:hydrogenase formation protein HypD [Megasphaera vaginalis (ex Bordigoni et al. 2020)]|uniref:hydrogenase formation protein HypD n=1 Tax=Megasphaera vaginalis (ex Bordigoni et al. 2020) TaxID=2045301 RepID=UPI000C7C346A|nr:hydrogenase formation protein HypD [Megasphaera vaginalis (ex Bordigoni et al. 2020)]